MRLLPLALLPLVAAGCYHTDNARVSVGREYTPASFQPSPPPATGADDAPLDQQPTLISIERRNWATTTVLVPDDRLAHNPVYTRSIIDNPSNARNSGGDPTAMSALDLTSEEGGENMIAEAALAPFAAAFDLILFPARAIATPPWAVVHGGQEPYRRSPIPNPYPRTLDLETARQVPPLVVPPPSVPVVPPPETRGGVPERPRPPGAS